MSIFAANHLELKAALKEALLELLQERRELFHDLFREVVEEATSDNRMIPSLVFQSDSVVDLDFEKGVEREIQAFHDMHAVLLERHAGEYVALHKGELVDHDLHKRALYQRIEKAYPAQFVLLRRVDSTPEQALYFRSPQFSAAKT